MRALFSFVAAAFVVACSSGSNSGGTTASADDAQRVGAAACAVYVAPAAVDLENPAVSFAHDVLPIFTRSCAFASCHGSAAGEGKVVLKGTEARAHLLEPSLELSRMPYVAPGDPNGSFLMHKLDGDQCTLDANCAGGSCLATMPKDGDRLSEVDRDVVRRWIAQGAPEN